MWFSKDASVVPRLQGILGLSLVGLLIAGVSLQHHYDTSQGWCDISTQFNCDVVNRGPYSEVLGIPVALMGVVGYAGVAALCLIALKKKDEQRELFKLMKAILAGALGFSLYLTYLEAFVLGVYCPLCLISLSVVIAMMVIVCAPSKATKL